MTDRQERPFSDLDLDVALRSVLEGTAPAIGEDFFTALVRVLCRVLGTEAAWVTEYDSGATTLRARAMWLHDAPVLDYEYRLAGTPCQHVFDEGRLVHIPDRVVELFPDDPDVQQMEALAYMGVPLRDSDGSILGHLAVMDPNPLPEDERLFALFDIFAARAAAELRRLRVEAMVREREEKLAGLVDGAMDAIIELDRDLSVTRMNPAAQQLFDCAAVNVVGSDFGRFLAGDSAAKLKGLIEELESGSGRERHLWISGGLEAVRSEAVEFPAEASLSRFEVRGRPFYSLILRDVNDRLEAERRIRSLTAEAEYLREEVRALGDFDRIIGESESLLRALSDVREVAESDSTVILFGETGTGKELFARAIHDASRRRDGPLVKVNCAAIPANLVESEFFGHEKGAFTGATAKREGRFALADGGTILLDEVGELSLDLQAKLLRVLQEGEFEPIGSSRSRNVDVRVLAATNRDLARAVEVGAFREDLYYRLNVFPIRIPPLRERGDDVILLAEAFVDRFSTRLGRRIEPLSEDCTRRLKAYSWPGNVRELQNVIERAVITSRDGTLNLDRALAEPQAAAASTQTAPSVESQRVRTVDELRELERRNILLALETCGWVVSGRRGAARLLRMHPSTL
ncbi:MAG: sigma 54-interacting transcriptional regulator, partial [Gemmatimonadales bacterium]